MRVFYNVDGKIGFIILNDLATNIEAKNDGYIYYDLPIDGFGFVSHATHVCGGFNKFEIIHPMINEFCNSKKCADFVKWDFGFGDCFSCKKTGQSYNVNPPDICNFEFDLIKFIKEI